MAAYTKVHRKNKKPYIAQMNGDTLEVIEKGKTIPGFHIKQGERILESSYSENTDDMVNRVYVYNSSNKKIGILTNTRWANMYGIFQSAITVDSGNGKQEAMNELKGISKNASLTSTGDYRCVSGLGVIIEDSRTGLKGRFWIESDSHEWKNGSYTMKLDLEFKNIMDTQEEDEEETSSSSSGSSESSALEDVLNQARSWIGIGENPPGSNHNEITVLYGMDAAWCCMFIWACFKKSGHADLFMGGAKEAYSAHVFVDDTEAYQALPYDRGAWHVGVNYGGRLFGTVNNRNAVGIEMCVQEGYNYEKAFQNTVQICKQIMKQLGIPADRVVQHYDVCAKNCPSAIRAKCDWNRFKQLIGAKTTTATVDKYYHTRKSWADSKSQIGAYKSLENAKKEWKEGYTIYDWNGKAVYPVEKTSAITLTKEIKVQLPVIKKGSSGAAVSSLQAVLGVEVDGSFGNDTETSLKVFQKNVAITADGSCGTDTWTKVFEHMKANTK